MYISDGNLKRGCCFDYILVKSSYPQRQNVTISMVGLKTKTHTHKNNNNNNNKTMATYVKISPKKCEPKKYIAGNEEEEVEEEEEEEEEEEKEEEINS